MKHFDAKIWSDAFIAALVGAASNNKTIPADTVALARHVADEAHRVYQKKIDEFFAENGMERK